MDFNVDIEPILSAECEDCGITIVLDPKFATVIKLDGIYSIATLCFHCERPLVGETTKEYATIVIDRGVKLLSWDENE
jgi:hypothetical protein